MSLDVAKLGTTFTADVKFYNSDSTPFQPKAPAAYTIKDFNGNLITSGLAAQDGLYPETWHASITLPDNAPFSNSQKYQIFWSITGGPSGNNTATASEYFSVQAADNYVYDDLDSIENESVIVQGSSLSDSLSVPPNQTVSTYTVRILDDNGNVYYGPSTVDSPSAANIENANVYSFSTGALDDLTVSFRPYVLEWVYTANGRVKREYHFLYVVNTRMLMLMDSLRKYINKANFQHKNPNMRYNEVDLIAYLIQGVQIVNYAAPMVTSMTLPNFPRELDWFLINAAAYVALSSQYLAEGVAAFDFNGQSVSLNIDRATSIDAALSRVIDVIRTDLPAAKTRIAKASVTGVLTLTPSPSFNPRFASGINGYDNGLGSMLGFDFGNRSAYYSEITDTLNSQFIGY